jgi:hypothetical protein
MLGQFKSITLVPGRSLRYVLNGQYLEASKEYLLCQYFGAYKDIFYYVSTWEFLKICFVVSVPGNSRKLKKC